MARAEEIGERVVRESVIADNVATTYNIADDIGVLLDLGADDKKNSLDAVLVEDIEHAWRDDRIGPIIESEQDTIDRRNGADSLDEDATADDSGSIDDESQSSQSEDDSKDD